MTYDACRRSAFVLTIENKVRSCSCSATVVSGNLNVVRIAAHLVHWADLPQVSPTSNLPPSLIAQVGPPMGRDRKNPHTIRNQIWESNFWITIYYSAHTIEWAILVFRVNDLLNDIERKVGKASARALEIVSGLVQWVIVRNFSKIQIQFYGYSRNLYQHIVRTL